MMRFRAGKYSEFERGRFLVAYHEDRLYSVRDEKRGTVTLVEARDPESAYLKASSIRPIPAVDVVEVVRCKDCKLMSHDEHGYWCINDYQASLDPEKDYCSRAVRRADSG